MKIVCQKSPAVSLTLKRGLQTAFVASLLGDIIRQFHLELHDIIFPCEIMGYSTFKYLWITHVVAIQSCNKLDTSQN